MMVGAGGSGTELVQVQPMVFVPAIMGAGLVFSVATIMRDLLSRGSRTMQVRRARIRGRLVAESVTDPTHADLVRAARPVGRAGFAAVGVLAAGFSVYILIGATGNFLRHGGYVNRDAWLWGANLVVAAAASVLAAACFAVVARPHDPPPWVWSPLVLTPLLGVDDSPDGERARWVVVAGLTVTVLLAAIATWPRKLGPVDRPIEAVVDEPWLSHLEPVATVLGSTQLTLVVAVFVGVVTMRCRRFAWVFITSVVISLAVTTMIRVLVDRPRPIDGPLAGGTDSFPSGHLVQMTLLATLVPLAIAELTRSQAARRWATILLSVTVVIVAVGRIANGHHAPTDVIAGAALGLAIGCWARLAYGVRDGHRDCGRCLVRSGDGPSTPAPSDEVAASGSTGSERP